MPLPLAPIAVFALRAGAVAGAVWATQRMARSLTHKGRTDQRAEDAMDALDAGLAVHAPADRAAEGQRNAAFRFTRTIRWGKGAGVELDATLLGRFRLRRLRAG